MDEQYPTTVPELEDRIETHRIQLLQVVDSLSEVDRDEIRDPAGWSTKDHVAHLVYWERSMDYLLTGRPRHEGLGVREATYLAHDVDCINAEIYQQHQARDWQSIRTEWDEVHTDLIDTLREVGWEGLQNSYSHFAPDEPGTDRGDPVIYYVAGNTFFHYDEHRGWIEELLAAGASEDRDRS